jgi:hypothetical protein
LSEAAPKSNSSAMSQIADPGINADIVAEAERLLELATAQEVPLRLLGGIAVRIRAVGELPEPFARRYADLDFVTAKGRSRPVQQFFRDAGYDPHVAFNALNGQERLLFFDDPNTRQVDIFVGAFSMSHRIPFGDRLELEPRTLPLAELLLTKLQIAEINEKDVCDGLALLHGHAVGDGDGDMINAARIGLLCAGDWGLWRTITGNLRICREYVDQCYLSVEEQARIRARIDEVLERVEQEPKTRSWKLRAKIGERKRWYEIPEEVAGGP